MKKAECVEQLKKRGYDCEEEGSVVMIYNTADDKAIRRVLSEIGYRASWGVSTRTQKIGKDTKTADAEDLAEAEETLAEDLTEDLAEDVSTEGPAEKNRTGEHISETGAHSMSRTDTFREEDTEEPGNGEAEDTEKTDAEAEEVTKTSDAEAETEEEMGITDEDISNMDILNLDDMHQTSIFDLWGADDNG